MKFLDIHFSEPAVDFREDFLEDFSENSPEFKEGKFAMNLDREKIVKGIEKFMRNRFRAWVKNHLKRCPFEPPEGYPFWNLRYATILNIEFCSKIENEKVDGTFFWGDCNQLYIKIYVNNICKYDGSDNDKLFFIAESLAHELGHFFDFANFYSLFRQKEKSSLTDTMKTLQFIYNLYSEDLTETKKICDDYGEKFCETYYNDSKKENFARRFENKFSKTLFKYFSKG